MTSTSMAASGMCPACECLGSQHDDGSSEIHQRLGQLTRQLHDALSALGLLDSVQGAMQNLPDARARLSYVQTLTGQAAERVLGAVERGNGLLDGIELSATTLACAWQQADGKGEMDARTLAFLDGSANDARRVKAELLDIMMAQDFHDLTGQVINRVLAVAQEIEQQLLRLLIDTLPGEKKAPQPDLLQGPVINPHQRADVVSGQAQVDELLASLGF